MIEKEFMLNVEDAMQALKEGYYQRCLDVLIQCDAEQTPIPDGIKDRDAYLDGALGGINYAIYLLNDLINKDADDK